MAKTKSENRKTIDKNCHKPLTYPVAFFSKNSFRLKQHNEVIHTPPSAGVEHELNWRQLAEHIGYTSQEERTKQCSRTSVWPSNFISANVSDPTSSSSDTKGWTHRVVRLVNELMADDDAMPKYTAFSDDAGLWLVGELTVIATWYIVQQR